MMRGSNMGILPYWLIILLITWGLLLYKAEFCLPIDPAYKAIYKKITWGLGRIRTIATPLDRHKATREITWGLGRIRTIATPLDWHKATREITSGLGRIRTIATPLDWHKATREITWGL